ncbi:hypothetical protein IGI04_036368 [Brassica rapa subsp. trilocularis]|uniref:Uncharacterized protein n=1 Tax=Brassica rapa subsp. trilocularis TaxID=1813537 RepID=A0ABQ7LHB6_BRACM|nr:hypothetical protein IGI04_036368 [Brassica rapa subsp. trilocularis]
MDALIKMLKENGNTHGYSFGASMIAKTIETSPCDTNIARIDRAKSNEQAGHDHLTLIVRGEGNLKLKKMVRMEPA